MLANIGGFTISRESDKVTGLIKKSRRSSVRSESHLPVSYYTVHDTYSGALQRPSDSIFFQHMTLHLELASKVPDYSILQVRASFITYVKMRLIIFRTLRITLVGALPRMPSFLVLQWLDKSTTNVY